MSQVNKEELSWLINTSASDLNFKMQLGRANEATILEALKQVEGVDGHKTREKALRVQLNKLSKQVVDESTEAAEQVVEVERLQEVSAEAEQQNREQMIAECHQVIGRIQATQMITKFGNVSELMWVKDIKESALYKEVPGLGSWENFCKSIGYTSRHINEQLANLEALGAQFLETVSGLRVGYRDLRKLRQLNHEGAVYIDDQSVLIGGDAIPLDFDHRDDLQAAIEKVLQEKDAELIDAKDTLRAKDRILESKENVINKQEKEIARHEARAEQKGFAPGEEEFLKQMEAIRVSIDGYLINLDPQSNPLPDGATSRMTSAYLYTLAYLRRGIIATHETAQDIFEEPEGEWDPDAELAAHEAEMKKANLRSV